MNLSGAGTSRPRQMESGMVFAGDEPQRLMRETPQRYETS